MKVLMMDGAGFSPPYDLSLTQALVDAGAEVKLVMPDSVRAEWEDADALPPRESSRLRRALGRVSKVVSHVRLLNKLERVVREWRPDVVHLQWLPLPLLDARFLRSVKGRTKLVHTMHNTSLFHGTSPGVQGWGLEESWYLFDRIIVHSEYSRRAALASGAATERNLVVVPHGPFDHYSRFVSSSPRPIAPVTILFAGAIKPYKGLDVLVESLPALAKATSPGSWRLMIAGHPSYPLNSLREQVERRGLQEYVTWNLRHQSERELGVLLGSSHIVVLPYREIDQSGVLLAAVGVARPVVATKVGAFPELLKHEQHGLLVAPNDANALGESLARMVNDADLRTRCENSMRSLACGSLRWSTIARSTLSVYKSIHRD